MREEAQIPQEGETPAPRARRLLAPIVLVAGLLTGTAAGAFTLGPRLFAQPAESTHEPAADEGHDTDAAPELVAYDNLVVNPANSGGTRFLLISVAFESRTPEAAAALRAAEPQVRDAFVTLLGRRSIAELSDLALRDTIRAQLLHAADSIVPGIRAMYIPQFILQ